jgi:hypothetical protein
MPFVARNWWSLMLAARTPRRLAITRRTDARQTLSCGTDVVVVVLVWVVVVVVVVGVVVVAVSVLGTVLSGVVSVIGTAVFVAPPATDASAGPATHAQATATTASAVRLARIALPSPALRSRDQHTSVAIG